MSGDLFFLRLAIGGIFIYHALPKLTKPNIMASGMGWSNSRVFALGMVEFISSLGIIGGIAIKLSALLLSLVMIGAIYFKARKWKMPFMAQNATGWEFDLILLASSLTIYINS
ncbi:MAG: hypothetical protein A3J46_06325 [Candidatus Yanofskybacteria bacterium RIFCSPHIGHO2_02_FULL_41_11]|uniref:DoxX family protein n=1 Tax=Candidatus Yanofskybacteria bacterium RIFCSPHIGHO2_02_FULL_41_11 TaxID=1802675 RepID=A0A1F8F4R0_9BACT|nr:MAG: hypothetical protein A3J46_06325 [Candidatus Yanofskybacteria bacterium RIFCSPHIGHO2_02_FULL_41_11]